ncbi:glucose-6-phosphate dehydrogenase [Actinospica durhamensis]|uniref:Glucose-6-phosphate 1-dehydrogenase n=1 Tax=Actinospica durhamensis TaxID=1508375 RepID=A0A941ER13_9ACTN|nr:glucose-6-phosphate dehydrogenase [Actinospica durhamensis]MBR7835583.1 glucose-6-phosphate dehydrogenase [Actinospica durhamensis]
MTANSRTHSDEAATRADALVLFGITGDLAKKMLLPALYELVRGRELDIPIVGVTRGGWTIERLREHAREAVAAHAEPDEDAFERFAGLLRLATVDYDRAETFASIAEQTPGARFRTHYLALPPSGYAQAASCLAEAGLADEARLIVEKPFGHDLDSARALQARLTEYFPEERLRRVDHYLGKDAIEDLLTIRFANTMLSELLHRHHVRSVQITMAEAFDVADRGGFYDGTGALRDVVQNHLLQMLAYLVMEAPRTGAAADILDERARALRAVRTVRPEDYVRGQYDGYTDVRGVAPGSNTETYAALRTYVDTDRWAGVPFTVRSGKTLSATATEIVAELHRAPFGYFHTACAQEASPNLIRFRISPEAGVTFDLVAQHEGDAETVEPVAARLDFTHLTGSGTVAYERILADAVSGDPRRFTRMDMVEDSWRILAEVLDSPVKPAVYARGGWGPAEAERLTEGGWHRPAQEQQS